MVDRFHTSQYSIWLSCRCLCHRSQTPLSVSSCSDFNRAFESAQISLSNKKELETSLVLVVLRPGFGPGSATFLHPRVSRGRYTWSFTRFDRTILPEHLDLECRFGLKFLTCENSVGYEKNWGNCFSLRLRVRLVAVLFLGLLLVLLRLLRRLCGVSLTRILRLT